MRRLEVGELEGHTVVRDCMAKCVECASHVDFADEPIGESLPGCLYVAAVASKH